MENLYRYKKPLIAAGAVVILGLIGYSIYNAFFTLNITSLQPEMYSVSTNAPQITIDFNKKIKSGSFTINPSATTTHVIDGSRVRVNIFNQLRKDGNYTLKVRAESEDGYKLEANYAFTPKLGSSLLSDRDSRLILARQQANKPAALNDPVMERLPYETLNYEISAIMDHTGTKYERITLRVNVFLNAAEVKIDRAGAFERKKSEAREYLKSLEGINVDNYTVLYVIAGEGI